MRENGLQGKVAIVTGAAQGIGFAISGALLGEGMRVLLTDIEKEALEKSAGLLRKEYGKQVGTSWLDVSNRESIDTAVGECVGRFGRIDILINNAGIVDRAKVVMVELESWNRVIAVNLTGTLLCSQAVIPAMRSAGGGVILNASSVSARIPDVNLSAYCVSKAGVEVLTKVMAAELAPYNIRVNAYAPGVTRTPMTRDLVEQRGEEKLRHISLKRFASPKDIGDLVVFLCSPRSAFITGAVVSIDGGTMIVEHPWRAWE